MATVSPQGAVGLMENSSMESKIGNQPLIDNHDTNLKTPTQMATPENGNQIGEKGESSSLSPNLKRKQLKEKSITSPCVSKTKTSQTNKEESLINTGRATDLTGVMNKEQYRVGKDNNNRIINASMGKTVVAIPPTLTKINIVEKGDDPLTMVLNRQESNGEGGKGPKHSFYCQQEHAAKLVGNVYKPKMMLGIQFVLTTT